MATKKNLPSGNQLPPSIRLDQIDEEQLKKVLSSADEDAPLPPDDSAAIHNDGASEEDAGTPFNWEDLFPSEEILPPEENEGDKCQRLSSPGADTPEPPPVINERKKDSWFNAGLLVGFCGGLGTSLVVGWFIFTPSGEEEALNYEDGQPVVPALVEEPPPAAVEPGTAEPEAYPTDGSGEPGGFVPPAAKPTEQVTEPEPAPALPQVEEPPTPEVWICDQPGNEPVFVSGSEAGGLVMDCGNTRWRCSFVPAGAELVQTDCAQINK